MALFLSFFNPAIKAQVVDSLNIIKIKDSLNIERKRDSLHLENREILSDTLKTKKQNSPNAITETVNYEAVDSIVFSFKDNLIFMYKNSKVTYGDIVLEAGQSSINLDKNIIKATYLSDTLAKKEGKPMFTQGEEKFSADTITYNFKTKKGLIKGIFTEQEGGYLQAEVTKKQPDNTIHILHGQYTTCDLEHPHYSFKMTKAKVTDDKIISGPVYFTVADIPTPLALPFGYFPKQRKQHSGILMPTYGEEQTRGFFLRNGGYYINLNDYWDLAIVGDIYSNGSWGGRTKSQYKKRYKFSGNFDINYSNNKEGEKGIDYSESKAYWINWSHRQDMKANPTASFSASVNFGSQSYNNYNAQNMNDYLSSSFKSSISYSKRWADSPFSLNTSISHSQNIKTKEASLVLPDVSFSMNQIFPFERKKSDGKQRWYEKISFSYNASARASSNTPDSLMFTKDMPIQAGFKHSAPIGASYKFLKFFTFSPRVDYEGVLYPYYVDLQRVSYTDTLGELHYKTLTDTTYNIKYGHSFGTSVSIGFSSPVYGMYLSKNKTSKFQALRHVITPSASFSYTPDMSFVTERYYKTYTDEDENVNEYSIFQAGIYNTPNSRRESGSINLSLNNKLEMKMLNAKDTAQNTKKVSIIDRFDLNTSYNIFADSMNWSPIGLSVGTKLFNQIQLTGSSRFDLYAVDSLGRQYNKFLFQTDSKKWVQFKSFNLSTGYSFDSKTFSKDKNKQNNSEDNERKGGYFGEVYYADFSVPWNLSFNYSLNINMVFNRFTQKYEPQLTQSLNFQGGFNLTPLWKVSFSSGYDLKNRKITYTTLNLTRDLHCWEMNLSAIPFGTRKSYFFQINVKSSILQDLKLKKEKSYLDY